MKIGQAAVLAAVAGLTAFATKSCCAPAQVSKVQDQGRVGKASPEPTAAPAPTPCTIVISPAAPGQVAKAAAAPVAIPRDYNFDTLDAHCARKLVAFFVRRGSGYLEAERVGAVVNGCPEFRAGGGR